MANIEEKVESLISKTIEDLGYELYDVIYEKEAQDYYLRVFIDTPTGISLEDCEKVNDGINDILDEANYIKDQYFLEVSSPGVERVLRKEKHLQANIGKEIVCHLFKPITLKDKNETQEDEMVEEKESKTKKKKVKKDTTFKEVEGVLQSFNPDKITLQVEDKNKQLEIDIERKNIANIKLKYHWN